MQYLVVLIGGDANKNREARWLRSVIIPYGINKIKIAEW